MGTYLATGIVQEIFIDKRQIKYPDISIDNITRRLKEEINLACYDYSEDSEGYYWKITPKMLEGNLAEFINTQFKMYQSKINANMQDVVSQLRKTTSFDEVIKLVADKNLTNFQCLHQLETYVRVIRDNGFDEHIMISYKLIAYFVDGKIITEGLGNSLKYFESNIRLQKDKYPIADCIKVMITS
jgi:hypothetical protein